MLVTASYSLASSMLGTDNKKNQFRNKKIKKIGKKKKENELLAKNGAADFFVRRYVKFTQ